MMTGWIACALPTPVGKRLQALQQFLFVDEWRDLLVGYKSTQRLSAQLCPKDSGANRGRGVEPHHYRIDVPRPDVPRCFNAGSRFVALESYNRHLRDRSIDRK